MRRPLYALTLALSLPTIMWQPRPVRAAAPDAPALLASTTIAPVLTADR